MSNQLGIFTDTLKNDYFVLEEYDVEVYGHKILENYKGIVFYYSGGNGIFFYDLESVQRTVDELKRYLTHPRWCESYVDTYEIFTWAQERMIHYLREKKLKNILEY